jgi:hypothetical protein
MIDSSLMITYVSCRWPGSMHDSRVYTNTSLYNISRTDAVDPWEPFPGAVVLADSAYLGIRNDGLLLPHPRHNRLNPHF